MEGLKKGGNRQEGETLEEREKLRMPAGGGCSAHIPSRDQVTEVPSSLTSSLLTPANFPSGFCRA